MITMTTCDIFTGLASILSLSSISVYRSFSVVAPMRHRRMDNFTFSSFIIFPWIIATPVSIFNAVIGCEVCFYLYTSCAIGIPCLAVLIIIISYVIVGFAIKRSSRACNSRTTAQRDRKTNVTLMIVTLASLFTWGPYQCFISMSMICPKCPYSFQVMFVMKLFQYLNSGLNIFVYIARMPDFKKAFVSLFCPQNRRFFRERIPNRARVNPVAMTKITRSNTRGKLKSDKVATIFKEN